MFSISSQTLGKEIKKKLPLPLKKTAKPIKKFFALCKDRIEAFQDDTEVYIVSYPNSGRTWLRVLLGKALCEHFNYDDKQMVDTRNLTQALNVLTTKFTHDCSLVDSSKSYTVDNLSFDFMRYRNKKIVLLIRDPRDLMVSYFFQQSKRDSQYQGSISDFIRDPMFGVNKLVRFNQMWFNHRQYLADMLLITYEDLRTDTSTNLKKILEFINVSNISKKVLDKSVEFASLNNMRKLEEQNYWQEHSRGYNLLAKDISDKESYKSRRGKVGGYSDYLNLSDIQYINHVLTEENCPCYSYLDLA